jgi:hypothetical protein
MCPSNPGKSKDAEADEINGRDTVKFVTKFRNWLAKLG